MTSVGIVNKCKLIPCSLQVFQGRYESSGSVNTVQFHFLNMNIAKRKQICWVTLVILLSRAGKWEMKGVICPLTVFRLVLCFENPDLLSAECRAHRLSPLAFDSRFFIHFSACVSCSPPEELLWLWGRGPQPAQMCPYVLMYVLHTIKSSDLKAESRILMHEPILGLSLPLICDFSQVCLPTFLQDQYLVCRCVFRLKTSLLLLWIIFFSFLFSQIHHVRRHSSLHICIIALQLK